MNIGVIGCGNICDTYFKNLARFGGLDVVACADLDAERARAKARQYSIPNACSTEELLSDRRVDLVLNLTRPAAHAGVTEAALMAGRHVYSEKPLAITRDGGTRLLRIASERERTLGCAPDTFMGSAQQTCRRVIDEGRIGRPVAATAFMMYPGHESWHPDPEFFYQPGGGPLFDMGPYYLTALVNLLGPVRRVTGSVKRSHPTRTIGSGPKQGGIIQVDVPTHVAGVLDFDNGATAMLMMSFDGGHHSLPCMEVYGTEGSLSVPDPNHFEGEVRLRDIRGERWTPVESRYGYAENGRGLGLADLVDAMKSGRPYRASAELAFHVLDIMQAIHEASRDGRHVELKSRCERPAPMKEGLRFGEV